METFAFWMIAAYTLFAAYFVVTARNLFRCAVGLAATLIGIAGLYLLMDAQFLSSIQIAVYVGGVVVLVAALVGAITVAGKPGDDYEKPEED